MNEGAGPMELDDAETVGRVARVAIGRPSARVLDYEVEALAGAGFVASIHRVRGVASAGDERVAWSVIRKHVAAGSERVEDLRYWRREPLAYRSGLLAGLTSVRTARCFEQTEDDSGGVMWLEDLPGRGAGTVEEVASSARVLAGQYARRVSKRSAAKPSRAPKDLR